MNKKIVAGVIFFVGIFMLIGAWRLLPDLRPLGAALALLFVAGLMAGMAYFNKTGNKILYGGAGLAALGLFGAFGAIGWLPDVRPVLFSVFILLAGLAVLALGWRSSSVAKNREAGTPWFRVFYWLVVFYLFGVSAVLWPMIDWQLPKDPAAVMILSFLTAVLMVYAFWRRHQAQKEIFGAGLIFALNFPLIKLYEAGFLDGLGKFYRLFEPLYASFDRWAEPAEWALIILTVVLVVWAAVKKLRVAELGRRSLWYFLLQPLMAIFFFEMLGLPAGFLAGATTRSDLLVSDTNAVMSTFGMVFIAVFMYLLFELFPVWVAPLAAGLWWVFWKPWLLHHPDPATFTSLAAFWPAAAFLFFTGLKRIALPLILLSWLVGRKKPANS